MDKLNAQDAFIPKKFQCPIGKNPMMRVVTTVCDCRFDQMYLMALLDNDPHCPECRTKLVKEGDGAHTASMEHDWKLQKQINDFLEHHDIVPDNWVVVPVSRSGTGKSSTMGNLTKQRALFRVGGGGASGTQEVIYYDTTFTGGERIRLYDTPGTSDTRQGASDRKILDRIASALAQTEGIDTFLFYIRFGELRDAEVSAVKDITDYFGKELLYHSIVFITHADSGCEARQLKEVESFKATLVKRFEAVGCGALRGAVERAILIENKPGEDVDSPYSNYGKIRSDILSQLKNTRKEHGRWDWQNSKKMVAVVETEIDTLLKDFTRDALSMRTEQSQRVRKYLQHVKIHGYRAPEDGDEMPLSFMRFAREKPGFLKNGLQTRVQEFMGKLVGDSSMHHVALAVTVVCGLGAMVADGGAKVGCVTAMLVSLVPTSRGLVSAYAGSWRRWFHHRAIDAVGQ